MGQLHLGQAKPGCLQPSDVGLEMEPWEGQWGRDQCEAVCGLCSMTSRGATLHGLVPQKSCCTCQQVHLCMSGPCFCPAFAWTLWPQAHWTLVRKQGAITWREKREQETRPMWGVTLWPLSPTPVGEACTWLCEAVASNLWKRRLTSCQPQQMSRGPQLFSAEARLKPTPF